MSSVIFNPSSPWVPTAEHWPAHPACSRSALQWLTYVKRSSPLCPPGGSSMAPTSWCHCSSSCTTYRTSWTRWPARQTSGTSPSSSTVLARWELQPGRDLGGAPRDAFPASEGGMSWRGRVATAHCLWCLTGRLEWFPELWSSALLSTLKVLFICCCLFFFFFRFALVGSFSGFSKFEGRIPTTLGDWASPPSPHSTWCLAVIPATQMTALHEACQLHTDLVGSQTVKKWQWCVLREMTSGDTKMCQAVVPRNDQEIEISVSGCVTFSTGM